MKCRKCRTPLPEEARFCHECGEKVKKAGWGLLKPVAVLTTVAVLALQLYGTIASPRPAGTSLLEAGIPHYVEDGTTYAVVSPNPAFIESVSRLVEGLGRFGLSTCLPWYGFKPPFSLEQRTISGTRLASVVEQVWVAGMGSAKGVYVAYNGTHAVITLAMDNLDYWGVTSALSLASEDVCVRVLIG